MYSRQETILIYRLLASDIFLLEGCLYAHFVELGGGDAHGAGLFWHDALGALAGDGVHFEEVELLLLGVVDEVEAHYAAAPQQVVEAVGDLLDVVGDGIVDLGGAYLVAEAVVLGLVVEELMPADGDDLRDGEDQLVLEVGVPAFVF